MLKRLDIVHVVTYQGYFTYQVYPQGRNGTPRDVVNDRTAALMTGRRPFSFVLPAHLQPIKMYIYNHIGDK